MCVCVCVFVCRMTLNSILPLMVRMQYEDLVGCCVSTLLWVI